MLTTFPGVANVCWWIQNWIFVFIPENFGAPIHLHYDISAFRRSRILYFSSTRPACIKQPSKEDRMINKSGYIAAACSIPRLCITAELIAYKYLFCPWIMASTFKFSYDFHNILIHLQLYRTPSAICTAYVNFQCTDILHLPWNR
jgi:hypothetical protein